MTKPVIETIIRSIQQFVLQTFGALFSAPACSQKIPIRVRVEDSDWPR